MKIIGIDLSGPANHKDTVIAIFEIINESLVFEDMILKASDDMIISAVKSAASGKAILEWFETVGIHGLPLQHFEHSHQIDACAAALAVWHWTDPTKKPKWYWDKTSEEHPFEVCC